MAHEEPISPPKVAPTEGHQGVDWDARYVEGSTGWDLGRAHPQLEAWALEWPAGQRVFIPGCGRGHDALMLARLGHEVIAADLSATALTGLEQRAAAEGLRLTTVLGDAFAAGETVAGSIDVLFEQTFLCAIDPALRPFYVDWAGRLLGPEGRLVANWFPLDRPKDMGGPPWGYERTELERLFAGWTWAKEAVPSGPQAARPMGEWFAELRPPPPSAGP